MTEVDRILRKGQFDKSFLKEEIICDFFVDEKRKKHWLILLDILSEIDNVCKKHNIQYTLFFGSLLGAVRHQGFIPWDDDIDIAMPRLDYERFIQLSGEFSAPYFLQTPYTDEGYFYSMAKVRNSNTSAVVDLFKYERFNQGIYVDVFPLDTYNEECAIEKYTIVNQLVKDLGTYMRRNNPNLDKNQRERLKKYSNRNPFATFELLHSLCRADENMECDFIGLLSSWIYGPTPSKQTYPKILWKEYKNINFYGLTIPIPKNYDEILKRTYGDYMCLPPKEKRGDWHYGITVDTDKPYTFYLDIETKTNMKQMDYKQPRKPETGGVKI